jgi:hypothetical protein
MRAALPRRRPALSGTVSGRKPGIDQCAADQNRGDEERNDGGAIIFHSYEVSMDFIISLQKMPSNAMDEKIFKNLRAARIKAHSTLHLQ